MTASPPPPEGQRWVLPTTIYVAVATLLLFVLAMLPLAFGSLAHDITQQAAPMWWMVRSSGERAETWTSVNAEVIALNEWEGTASIRVSAHQSCTGACASSTRLLFVSVYGDNATRASARPASETVMVPASARDVMQVIRLPLYGDPIRYPFDRYQLGLAVLVDRIGANGTAQRLSTAEARSAVEVSLQARVPRVQMADPEVIDPATLESDAGAEPYASAYLLTLARPVYLEVLTVLLVLLVSAAAAYAMFLRPLDQLIINAGALVLGVWGIRAVLLGTAVPGVTAVDLSLIGVILFLLVTLTVRTLYLLEERSRVRLLHRRAQQAAVDEATTRSLAISDYRPGLAPVGSRNDADLTVSARQISGDDHPQAGLPASRLPR